VARRRGGGGDGVIGLLALLPWWVGVVLAVVSYFVMHELTQPGPAASGRPGQSSAFLIGTIVSSGAAVLQYILPIICLAGAGLSAWKRRERKALVEVVTKSSSAGALDGMSWKQFEVLVGEAFRLQGYRVSETGGGGPDGGVDLVLTKGSETFLVQAKQWKAYKVGVDVVRQLYGVMAAKGAAGGFVVTSGRFTDEARKFAEGRNVKLVDGEKLFGLIRQAQASMQARPGTPTPQPVALQPEGEPACPACGAEMVKRTAKKGAKAGTAFWGCISYPGCRGTRPIA